MADRKEPYRAYTEEEFWGNERIGERKKKKKKRRPRILLIVFIIIFAVFSFAGYYVASELFSGLLDPTREDSGKGALASDGDRLNLLILGVDRRGNEPARADTVMVAFIDRHKPGVSVLSIPRDTYLPIPGRRNDKIAHAHAYGGAELTREAVEDFLDVPIHGYVEVDFEGFKKVVDAMRGIEIDVEKRMYYPEEGIDLRPGLQRLDGPDALAYVRYRGDGSDLTRIERQQKFLRELAAQAISLNSMFKLPGVVREINNSVETDLGFSDMLTLARVFQKVDADRVETALLPGTPTRINGVSYWRPDYDQKNKIIDKFFARNGLDGE